MNEEQCSVIGLTSRKKTSTKDYQNCIGEKIITDKKKQGRENTVFELSQIFCVATAVAKGINSVTI